MKTRNETLSNEIARSVLPDSGYDSYGLEGFIKGIRDCLDGKPNKKSSNAYQSGYKEAMNYINKTK